MFGAHRADKDRTCGDATGLLRYTGARLVKQKWSLAREGRIGRFGFLAPRRCCSAGTNTAARVQGYAALRGSQHAPLVRGMGWTRRFPPEWFRGSVARHSGPRASVSRQSRDPQRDGWLDAQGDRGSRVPTEAAGLAEALPVRHAHRKSAFEPRATGPRDVPPRRTKPRAGAGPVRERSLLERVPGGFRTSATARFTLAGVNRAFFLSDWQLAISN